MLLAALALSQAAYSGSQGHMGMDGMPEQSSGHMMNFDAMHNQMHDMSEMMNQAHNTRDMNKRHELMQKHMTKMQELMGNINTSMGGNMPGNMSMEQRQEMMGNRLDMMQGIMEQMLKQQSLMMDK